MKAYAIESAGGPEVLQLRDIPTVPPQADEVRIGVRAFGFNRAEVYRHAGSYAEEVTVLRAAAPQDIDVALEVVGASTVRDSLKALKLFGTAVVIGLLGGAPVLESLHPMNDLPAATRLAFFPSGLFGTAALPASDAVLEWIAGQVASGAMPSLRVQAFDFDAVRRAHSLIESDRAIGKLVVMA